MNIFKSIYKKIIWHLINKTFEGTKGFKAKRRMLNRLGHNIGKNTKIVTPCFLSGKLVTGENCWIGRNFSLNGNGYCYIGDNVDIGPDVSILTGSHEIGDSNRRAGLGKNNDVYIGSGTWICAKSTILGGKTIGSGSVVGACSFVNKNVDDDSFVGGVPASEIKKLL